MTQKRKRMERGRTMSESADIREVYEEASRYLGALEKGTRGCAEHFSKSDNAKGLELLVQIIEGLEWLIGAMGATKAMHTAPVDTKAADGVFSEIVQALENGDFPFCGELLEFELLPVLEQWRAAFAS